MSAPADVATYRFLTTLYSAIATSHTFGKVLERQPPGAFARYLCQKLRLCVFVHRQSIRQPHFALQNHLDILSDTLESLASLATAFSEARKRLQTHVDTAISVIAIQTDVPIGHGCLPLLVLWDQLDPDGPGFYASTRNVRALQAFCSHLAHADCQVNDDLFTIRALQGVVAVFRKVQAVGGPIGFQSSLPERLYESIDSILRLRLAGGGVNGLGLPAGL